MGVEQLDRVNLSGVILRRANTVELSWVEPTKAKWISGELSYMELS